MTREEAINHLGTYRFQGINHTTAEFIPAPEVWQEAMEMAISALREQPRWISVEERLPEETGVYLVHDISMGIRVFYFGKGEVRSGWFGVTHWMPLPEPPKEEEV